MKISSDLEVTLVGHPFSSTGMGEQIRAAVSSLRASARDVKLFDIFRYAARVDPAHVDLISKSETTQLPRGVRIFHINGNEVAPVLKHLDLAGHKFSDGYNVIVPAWELPRYPAVWAKQLARFDEVWAISKYVKDVLAGAGIDAKYVGQSVEVAPKSFLPKRFFSIRESAFVLLQFFDTTSFFERKNPFATIELYKRLRHARPWADIQLVLKVKHGEESAKEWEQKIRDSVPDAVIITDKLSTHELHSLIFASDCFVSLHRAEGFGRGTGEAMSMGRLALATAWSGNLDYMTAQNSLLVNYKTVNVLKDQYPHWQRQTWAEPDIGHALELLTGVIDDPERGARIAKLGRCAVQLNMHHRAVGLRMSGLLDEIARRLQSK